MRFLRGFIGGLENVVEFLLYLLAMVATVLVLGSLALGAFTLVVVGLIDYPFLMIGGVAALAVVYGGAKLYLVQPRA